MGTHSHKTYESFPMDICSLWCGERITIYSGSILTEKVRWTLGHGEVLYFTNFGIEKSWHPIIAMCLLWYSMFHSFKFQSCCGLTFHMVCIKSDEAMSNLV